MSPQIKGKAFHAYLVNTARDILQDHGFVTSIEVPMPLPDGRKNFIDLVGKQEQCTLAVEVETTERYVVSNTHNAATLELPLFIVVPSPKIKRRVLAKLARYPPTPKSSLVESLEVFFDHASFPDELEIFKPRYQVVLLAQLSSAIDQFMRDQPKRQLPDSISYNPKPKGITPCKFDGSGSSYS